MSKDKIINVSDKKITVIVQGQEEYISLTDMVKTIEDGEQLIKKWLSTKNTVEYLGVWERLKNPKFNLSEFVLIKNESGSNKFSLSVKQWVSKTQGIGLQAKSGRYGGGTFAHKDIALKFAAWISPEFELLIILEFQRLKNEEAKAIGGEWDYRRFLAKVYYTFQTDAVKENIVPVYENLTKEDLRNLYASEADMLNIAVFGKTAKQWRQENPKYVFDELNIRDVATIPQLTVIASLETINSRLIKDGIAPQDRLIKLKEAATDQLIILSKHHYSHSIESPFVVQNTTAQLPKKKDEIEEPTEIDEGLKTLLNTPSEKHNDEKK